MEKSRAKVSCYRIELEIANRIDAYQAQVCRNLLAEAMSSEEVSFTYPDGTVISGRFEIEGGVITVTAADGRVMKASIEDSMLSPETLAKVLLLKMYKNNEP